MTYTTAISAKNVKALVAVLAVATVAGLAMSPRDNEMAALPVMAQEPVVMPDGRIFYAQKYEVSVAEWNACFDTGHCTLGLRATGDALEEEMPATGLSFVDVTQYLAWINDSTGRTFRLPTVLEWAHMADEVLHPKSDPIFSAPELGWASTYLLEEQGPRTLRPRGTFETTSLGIVDLNGSVWEWTQDCYAGASGQQITNGNCPAYFVAGEHIAAVPYLVRNPARGGCAVGTPPAHLGMRLVSDTRIASH